MQRELIKHSHRTTLWKYFKFFTHQQRHDYQNKVVNCNEGKNAMQCVKFSLQKILLKLKKHVSQKFKWNIPTYQYFVKLYDRLYVHSNIEFI